MTKEAVRLAARNTLDDILEEALGFLIEHAKKNRGTVAELARRMSKRLGRKVHRQTVECWLETDAKRRMIPSLPIGLLLIQEGSLMVDLERNINSSIPQRFIIVKMPRK